MVEKDFFQQKLNSLQRPLMIAGACSAESFNQVLEVVSTLNGLEVDIFRFGIWKPRTNPGNFEGYGKEALKWIKEVKTISTKPFSIEVANSTHVEMALRAGVDILWIGARTTVNPFSVQDIADALKGVDIPILVKNPINPDLKLWIGGIERIKKAGISSIGAVHRGFSSYETTKYRNEPFWQIPIALKQEFPEITLIGDPSHIAGEVSLVPEVAQKILDLNYDGLMVETHPNPAQALSDNKQQIPLALFKEFQQGLVNREHTFQDKVLINLLDELRNKIDTIDSELIELLSKRAGIINKIGRYKKDKNVAIFQPKRWKEIIDTRTEWGEKKTLSSEYVEKMYRIIHDESLRVQTNIFKENE